MMKPTIGPTAAPSPAAPFGSGGGQSNGTVTGLPAGMSAAERERFGQWQRSIEHSVQQANEGVQLILERLVNSQLGEAQHSTTSSVLGGHGFGVTDDHLAA